MAVQWTRTLQAGFQAMRDKDAGDLFITCGEHRWEVHQMILGLHSPVLFKMCQGPFREARERTIDLSEEHHTIIDWIVDYFYEGNLEVPHDDTSFSNMDFTCRIYIMADKYDIQLLKELALERALEALEWAGSTDLLAAVRPVFDASLVTKPLRTMLVREMVKRRMGEADGGKLLEPLSGNPDFVFDLAMAYLAETAELKQQLSKAKNATKEAQKKLSDANLKIRGHEHTLKSQREAIQVMTGATKFLCRVCGSKTFLPQTISHDVALPCSLCQRSMFRV